MAGCRQCRQFVNEFAGEDCIEGRPVVHKEHPDVGVFIFQVGEGVVENSSNSVLGGTFGPLGIMQGVQGRGRWIDPKYQ